MPLAMNCRVRNNAKDVERRETHPVNPEELFSWHVNSFTAARVRHHLVYNMSSKSYRFLLFVCARVLSMQQAFNEQ